MTDTVRAVKRALTLIQLMNKRDSWTLHDIAEESNVALSTAFRLLHTLQCEGYVYAPPKRLGVYRLTSKVRELGAGLTSFTMFADLANPIIITATHDLGWPVSFAMPTVPFMRIVSCGMPYFPERSAKPTSIGKERWMFSSAVGIAYLSRCPEAHIETCLKAAMTEHESAETSPTPDPRALSTHLADVRAAGYALRIARGAELNSAMAVPVLTGDRVIGAIACSTFPRSLSRTFIRDVLPPLIEAASQIAQACSGDGALACYNEEGSASLKPRPLSVMEHAQAADQRV